MKYHILAVRDIVANVYGQPFAAANIGAAIRDFGDQCTVGEGFLAKHPEDFELYKIGVYDDETGTLEQTDIEGKRIHDQLAIGGRYTK